MNSSFRHKLLPRHPYPTTVVPPELGLSTRLLILVHLTTTRLILRTLKSKATRLLLDVDLHEKTIGQLPHPSNKVTIDVGHPKMISNEAEATRIDKSRSDQLQCAPFGDSEDLAIAF